MVQHDPGGFRCFSDRLSVTVRKVSGNPLCCGAQVMVQHDPGGFRCFSDRLSVRVLQFSVTWTGKQRIASSTTQPPENVVPIVRRRVFGAFHRQTF